MQNETASRDDLERISARLGFLEELFAKIAERNRALELRWEDFPRLTTDVIAGNRRFKAVMAGRGKGTVNLSVCLKRFMKEHFPEYVFRDKQMDYHWFAKCLTPQSNILLLFERVHHGGLGKTYTIKMGLEVDAQSHMYSVFRCFDHRALEWTYGLQDELNECLKETRALLRLALPEFEQKCREYLESGESELVTDLPRHGPLSFLDAVRTARQALEPLCPEYSVIEGAWLGAHTNPDRFVGSVRHRLRVSVTPSGRLEPGQAWSVRFADIQSNRTATVVIPYCGRLQFIRSEVLRVNRSNVHHLIESSTRPSDLLMLPCRPRVGPSEVAPQRQRNDEMFADSDEIMACAEAAGGADYRRRNLDCSIMLGLDAEISEPPIEAEYWSVRYNTTGFYVTVSARRPVTARWVKGRSLAYE